MANLRIVSLLAVASALMFAGCSKDEPEAASEPSMSEGSEQATSTTVEEWRAEEERPAEDRVADPGVKTETGMTDPNMQPAPGTQTSDEVQGSAKGDVTLSDGEIAKITDTVNSGEVEQAKVARNKAKSASVKKFAAHMISEHTKAKQDGAKLVRQEKLVTQDNAVATELSNGAEQTLQSLRSVQGADFDRQYISAQVEQHQKVLDMLDKQLIPSADSAELKAQLEKARAMVEKHLTEAREIQQELTTAD